jgi:hypothetical protein
LKDDISKLLGKQFKNNPAVDSTFTVLKFPISKLSIEKQYSNIYDIFLTLLVLNFEIDNVFKF